MTQFSRMPWSPKGSQYASRDAKGETSSKVARNLLLATPIEKLRKNKDHSFDGTFSITPDKEGKVSLAKVKPYRKVYQDFPIALSDPNRMRDLGTDFGNAKGDSTKYAYRMQSPEVESKKLRTSYG